MQLAYATAVGNAHRLDLYVPTWKKGPFPVVLFQPGSAFMSDDPKDSPVIPLNKGPVPGLGSYTTTASLVQRWVPRGYAIAGVNVRSSSEAHFPEQIYDLKAAIRFLRANASKFHLDTDRFATMGTSSGSFVTTFTAITSGRREFEGDLGNDGQSSAVQACIDLFGPTDFLSMDAELPPAERGHDLADSPESKLMGYPLQSRPMETEKANISRYVRRSSPPIYISHGLADPLVPHQQSQKLFAAYQRAHASASLTLVPDAQHTDGYLRAAKDSAGCTVATTENGKTTRSSGPAPTYDTLVAFLNSVFEK